MVKVRLSISRVSFLPRAKLQVLIAALPLCVPSVAVPQSSEAKSPVATAAPTIVETITVIAHRQPRAQSEVVGTVTVMDNQQLDQQMAIDVRDMVRYEPGVEISNSNTRFGYEGFTIRGIGGNRTAVVVDNVPIGDSFAIQNFSNTGRGLAELGLVGSVEVLRGPASTLYGSKALGGVVAMKLLDADDLLGGASHGGKVSIQGHTDSNRVRLQAASAWQKGDYSLLLGGASQINGETQHAKTLPAVDRLDRQQNAMLMRIAKRTNNLATRLSLDAIREDRETDIRAMIGHSTPPYNRFVNTNLMRGDDQATQWRVVLDQEFQQRLGIDRGTWRIWYQRGDTTQDTYEERMRANPQAIIERRFWLQQTTSGVGADLENAFTGWDSRLNRLGYGFEVSQASIEEYRDGSQTDPATGQSTNMVLGEAFPIRDFPKSDVLELGIYLHHEIELWRQGPTLSPGLRYEYYKLSAHNDPMFESAFPDADITNLNMDAWLPKLGLLWPLNTPTMWGDLEWFAQYARGFRAPPFGDVNIGFAMPAHNTMAIPNPDLKAEEGRTVETGLRWHHQDTRVELTAFRNHYKNFIETRAALGFDSERGALVFQSLNRDRVRIEGAEMRLRQQLHTDWHLSFSAEWTRGFQHVADESGRRHLADVSPAKGILEIGWQPKVRGGWLEDYDSRLYIIASKGQKDLYAADGSAQFSTPGYATVDWINRWFLHDHWQLNLGLFNLTDRQYWRHTSVVGRSTDDPLLPLRAEPGRSVSLGITKQW